VVNICSKCGVSEDDKDWGRVEFGDLKIRYGVVLGKIKCFIDGEY
jgi:hypothetical protein